jgi:hypothetical protein
MDYKTYRHKESGEQIMTDPRHAEGKRVEGDSGWDEQDSGAGTRIVETADPDKASRIGYQNPAGNTAASTADLNAPQTPDPGDTDDDAAEETDDGDTETGPDEFDAPPSTFDRKS